MTKRQLRHSLRSQHQRAYKPPPISSLVNITQRRIYNWCA